LQLKLDDILRRDNRRAAERSATGLTPDANTSTGRSGPESGLAARLLREATKGPFAGGMNTTGDLIDQGAGCRPVEKLCS